MMGKTMVLLLILVFCCSGTAWAVEEEQGQMNQISLQCEKYGLSSALVYGVIMAESGFDVKADSGSSKGVMQLNKNTYPKLAEELGIVNFDVFDYEDNVVVGVYYLASLRDYWAEQGCMDEDVVALMLISYNRGLAGCRRYVEKHGLEAEYVDKVLGYKWELESGV